jgi:hypothetical protein
MCREWDNTLVEAAGSLQELSPNAVAVLYANADQQVVHGMTQLARAEYGMKVRRAADSAIEGPFILNHEESMSDKELITWYRANKRKGRK